MGFDLLFIAAGAITLIVLFAAHARRAAALRRLAEAPAPPEPPRWPSVTLLRPIKGLDAEAAQNVEAAFAIDYPGEVETIFLFDDETEPALPLVRSALERHGERAEGRRFRVLLCGEPPPGRTGKLNAMIHGLREASGELIACVDSDTRADPLVLRELVATLLADPGAGAAFAPVAATAPPETAGDTGYALLLNGVYAPAAALAAERNGGALPFIMGQFMVFRREALAAIGGFDCAAGQFVDDMYIGLRLTAAGFRNVYGRRVVPIIQRGLPSRAALPIFVRWFAFGRSGLPARGFKTLASVVPLLLWCGLGIAAAAALAGAWAPAALGLGAAFAASESANRLHERAGGAPIPPRFRWVAFALFVLAPFVMLFAFRRRIDWRGRAYDLDAHARLAVRPH